MEPRRTVATLFLSSVEALLVRDLKLPWVIRTFAHEILYLGQEMGVPFGYTFTWSAHGPHSMLLEQDLLPSTEWATGDPFMLREESAPWIHATYRLIRPPAGIDPFEFDRWIRAVCVAHRLHASGVACPVLVSAILTDTPALAAFAPEAAQRVC